MFRKKVLSNLFKQKPVNSFTDVLPADPVIAIIFVFKDFLSLKFILLNKFNGFLLNIAFDLLNSFI